MSITRRSHYIPQFYFDNFTIGNLLYEYNKSSKVIEQKSPKGVGWEPYYNIFVDYHLKKNKGLEKFLNFCENRAVRSIQRIIDNDKLSEPDFADFMIFMSMMKFRVPKFKEYVKKKFVEKERKDFFKEYKSIKAREQFIKYYNKKTRKETSLTKENFFKKVYVSDEAFEDSVYFYHMLKSGFGNAKEFIKKDYFFIEIYNDSYYFITSDDPLITLQAKTYDLKVLGIINFKNTEDLFIFPLSKNIILLLFGNDSNEEPAIKGRIKLDKIDYAMEINEIIFKESYNFIYSPTQEMIKNFI